MQLASGLKLLRQASTASLIEEAPEAPFYAICVFGAVLGPAELVFSTLLRNYVPSPT